MCSVSAISDYYTRQWPNSFPSTPDVLTVADPETKRLLKEVMDRLDKIDKRLGDVECMDAEKAKWLAQLAGEVNGQ